MKFFLHELPSKRWFRNGIHNLLTQNDDVIYVK